MPVVKEVNFKGEVIGDFELSDAVFGAPVHVPAMHQVVVAHLANCRVGTHNTKDRGDVRGGGKKPWRQKHTGRARAGSSRSPIWVGGGVAHGPHPRDYHQKVNKKVRRLALCSALTLKVQEENMLILERFDVQAPKTKVMLDFLTAIDSGKKPLFVLHETNMAVVKSAANIPGAEVMHVDSINVYDLLNHDQLIATPEAVKKLEEVFG
ncbi:MAG: 50S ribosomal protein L4 [Synergistaceae bacterium]|jgi:large subunit ribosomal protein L4|nr:50S ribosomal protein L4 [Synergistaceae bacterium]MCK9558687.1 50S ribosomal protein L4 [Candidatus Cloacimonadota bacterium]MDY9922145.1 50S ribosomal protein L4 [Synergistota bacterium]PKL05598.1 MAG: 50S ribosomal protein L4 [Synergistetes bacterium HGW-Synergistetes-1]MBP9974816.1 50S ribosomal protein L4 [Synergistaceae bacterium]